MKHLLATFLVIAGVTGVACYQDDTLHPPLIAPTKVFITDGPFPFDTVASVNIYVKEIAAATVHDTITSVPTGATPTVKWTTIVEPKKRFDLLTLQQGTTAFVGQQAIDAGKYVGFRMTIDADSSSIKFNDGSSANIQWPYPYSGEIPLYAEVDQPLSVPASGGEIVIDFDLGRSFIYNLTGAHEFRMVPSLRAVNSAATGAIAGVVTAPNVEGNPTPVGNATVSVFSGAPAYPMSWNLIATGRSDAAGNYRVGFLNAGGWIVQIEQPDLPGLAPSITPTVLVVVGDTTRLNVQLPRAGAGGVFLNIAGPTTVGYGGTIVLLAAVGDSAGIPEANPQVTWQSRDTAIALVLQDSSFVADSLSHATVLGRSAGSTWIVATSGTLQDSVSIQVVNLPPPNPVFSITLTPPSMTLAKGDSSSFTATLRDSLGNVLTTPQISWFFTDSSGVATIIWQSGNTAWIHANISGSTSIRAASQSKFKDAPITVP